MRRRGLLVLGGVTALAVALPPLLRRLPTDAEFVPLPGVPGFRLLAGGATSGGPDPFAGLSDQTPPVAFENAAAACRALFGADGWTGGQVPVAIFSDFSCPYCKQFEAQLMKLEETGAPIRLIWHELPLLGERSRRAAQAVLAARALGAERAARDYLWLNAMPPGPVGLRRMAEALGLDAAEVQRIATGPEVAASLSRSLALGMGLGLLGTPSTFFGRTLVVGAIRPADQRRLIDLESGDGGKVCA